MVKININNFSEKLYLEELDNGLKVYMLPYKYKKNFFCMMFTKFGGKNLEFIYNGKKYKVPSGVAHFLEHKLFESNNKKPFNFYAKSGTAVNASTNYDYTGYYFTGNSMFMKNLKYLINWLSEFEIDDVKVSKEKGIILEEANMYKDNSSRVLYEKVSSNTLVNDNKRFKVIGTDSDIKSITKEDLELCYNAFYNPSNMYLVIVGNFDKDKTLSLIKEEYKKFSFSKSEVKNITSLEPDYVSCKYEVVNMDIDTPKIAVNYKMNKKLFNFMDNYKLGYYLFMIASIGFGNTSSFYEKCYNEGLFLASGFQLDEIDSHYILSFTATSEREEELLNRLNCYVKDITLTYDDFVRTKKTWIASEVKMIDSINSTLYNIVDDIIDYGEYKNNKIDDIKKLSFDELLEVKKSLNFDNSSVVIIKK